MENYEQEKYHSEDYKCIKKSNYYKCKSIGQMNPSSKVKDEKRLT